MSEKYSWPKAELLYPDRGKKSYRMKRFRYHLRSTLHHNLIKQFEDWVNQSPKAIEVCNTRGNFSYPLTHRFLDKRFSARKRFSAMLENLAFLCDTLYSEKRPALWLEPIALGEVVEGFELFLNINTYQAMEGFCALELREKQNDQVIYLLTFGKLDNALLIAAIQGPNFEGSKEMVKLLTKKCHGLRPAYLMIESMKLLTRSLGFDQLLGIPHRYQNKSRWVQSKRYVVDYDVMFSECSGNLKTYWELPLSIETKNIEEVESKKRSMYRKRYAMLEHLLFNMQSKLNN